MKKLKHVKLYEAFTTGDGPFLIGFYGEGGIGSHPSIFSESYLENSSYSKHEINGIKSHWDIGEGGFQETSKSGVLPDALICVFDEDYQWDIKGISKSTAEEVMSIMGGDHASTYDGLDPDKIKEIIEMTGVYSGLPLDRKLDFETIISIILNPQPNTVYWSDIPEETHGYWEPPYKPMSLEDLGM
jgi:hypothetical protein